MSFSKRLLSILLIGTVLVLSFVGCSAEAKLGEAAIAEYSEPSSDDGSVEILDDQLPLADEAGKPSQMEMEIFALCNAIRVKNGLPEFEWSNELYAVAKLRSGEIITKFSHTRPNKKEWLSTYKEAGISYSLAGENLAMGHSTAKEVVDSWMASKGHKENILSKNTHFATAVKKCPDNSPYYRGYAFVELFMIPA